MSTTTYQLQTLTCPSCINKITTAVSSLPGVKDVEVLFNASKVKVSHEGTEEPSDIRQTIERLGYEVLSER